MKEINTRRGKTLIFVTAMVITGLVCVIGSAAAVTTEASAEGTAAAMIAAVLTIGVVIGTVAYMRWSAKKGHTINWPHLVKALNAAIVHRITAVNARYAFKHVTRATSPRGLLYKTRLPQ